MIMLINDLIQNSDADAELKTPSLADLFGSGNPGTITLDDTYEMDYFGIGNTDATQITINSQVISLSSTEKNGLYPLNSTLNTNTLTVSTNGTYIGRFAIGKGRQLGAAPSREPGFYTTEVPRTTASGQIVPGAGGVSGKRIGLDFRYKIDLDIFTDFQIAYNNQIAKGFPFFLYFDKETHRMPWERLYAGTDNQLLFQSAVNRFLYSRRFEFREQF